VANQEGGTDETEAARAAPLDRARLARMRDAARGLRKPNAAAVIAEDALRLVD
jgi:UDP-N-acetylglucosamine:LPS N-acetylglucosamine transferase